MTTKISDILYLFNRPTEPCYVPKGKKKAVFDIPESYVADKYCSVAADVINRFANSTGLKIPVKEITLPDLTFPLGLGRRDPFSLFIPAHREMAARLIEILMGMKTFDDLLSASVYCRDRINPSMFIYALSVVLLHRPDTKDLQLPSLSEILPEKFMDNGVCLRAREEANLVPAKARKPIIIKRDNTASDRDVEHRLAYFREDLGINLHHWHWHLVYPNLGSRDIVAKDRRGELFYYMHQQILARYNAERLCNHLMRVKPFKDLNEPIVEGYFPKLDCHVASRNWPARSAGATLSDIDRPADKLKFGLEELNRWKESIYSAIQTGRVVNDRQEIIELTEMGGIDILGNMLEAVSSLSPDSNRYGDLHGSGHVAIGYCHDPDNRYLEFAGVMGDTATAMRDPIFYRWHAFIDSIFQSHKSKLDPYNVRELDYEGIRITDVQVITPNQPINTLSTFWQQSDVDLSGGLDFAPDGPVLVRFTHLNHSPFTYRITVNNEESAKTGTVRIFMACKKDERGLPFPFCDQRLMMIELDKFTVNLQSGNNIIERKSDQSSVTIPFERTFRKLNPKRGDTSQKSNFCGCGWPQHMLIPKGSEEGTLFDLFVMISDFSGDRVLQNPSTTCNDAASYCGIRDRKYPDCRAMGFPFDRRPRDGVDTLSQFLTGNMRTTTVTIRLSDKVTSPVEK